MTEVRNMEIRKLPFGSLTKIIDTLEINEDWKKLMSKIPKHPLDNHFEPKYNNEHVGLIENHSRTSGRKCTAILFEEWGTSGRVRPTLHILKDILLKCEMYRAADEVALLLKEAPPQRPSDGPAAPIDTDLSLLLNNETARLTTYDIINNKTTAQMKSVSDFIKFSNTSKDMQNMSIFTPTEKKCVNNETASNLIKFSQLSKSLQESADSQNDNAINSTKNKLSLPIKSESDYLKFSNDSSYSNSFNMPNMEAFMNDHVITPNTSTINASDTATDFSDTSDTTSASNATVNDNIQESGLYQMSFPNIEVSENINVDEEVFQNSNLVNFKYEELTILTNNFSELFTGVTGKIGMGGFGEVFVAVHPQYGALAIKKAHTDLLSQRNMLTMKLFTAEVKYLSQFHHDNIVPILGFSRDGPAPCIVCEYIDGGSLEQRIAAKALTEPQRISIMVGTAEGLRYLHKSELYDSPSSESENTKRNNFVHGDVKSANILLTKNNVPKLCDFGLGKQYNDTFVTTAPMGTSAYMAPEGLSGTITQKVDIYSFGIVILELLTGLKSIVLTNNEQINIRDYVEEYCEIGSLSDILDNVVKNWTKGKEIYRLANECLVVNRKKRIAIEDVCERLYQIQL